jgi:hypothetical protein
MSKKKEKKETIVKTDNEVFAAMENAAMNRIERDKLIWNTYTRGLTVKDVAEETGVTQSVVRHVIKDIESFAVIGPVDEFFAMAEALHARIAEAGGNADDRIGNVMRGLWAAGIVKRGKLRNMSAASLDELLATRRMRNAGKISCDAIRSYRASLRSPKKQTK